MVIVVLQHQGPEADIGKVSPAQLQQLITPQQLTLHHALLLFSLFWAQDAIKCIQEMTAKQFTATAVWCVQ